MKILKWLLGAFLVFALILGAAALFLGPQIKATLDQSRGPTGPEVRVQPAERGRIVRTVSAPGDIEPRSRVAISARTSAQIVELPFQAGDTVKADDIVVRLDDKDLLAALESARARLRGEEARARRAEADLTNASIQWERITTLFNTADVPESEVDDAEVALRRAEADLAASQHAITGAQADVDRANEALKYTTIRSPIDGRVTVLSAEVGEIVVTGTMNNAGTVIMQIADLSEMLVRAQVDEIDIARVEVGQTAQIYVNAYPDEAFEGEVRRIALQSTQAAGATKFYDTEVAVYMGDRSLYAGLSATVDIEVETAEGVLRVPSQAVMDKRVEELESEVRRSPHVQRDKTFTPVVFVYQDGKVIARPVEIGFSDLTETLILAGLDEGEHVVVGPWSQLQKLAHNDDVRLEEEEDDASADGDDDSADPPAATPDTETTTS